MAAIVSLTELWAPADVFFFRPSHGLHATQQVMTIYISTQLRIFRRSVNSHLVAAQSRRSSTKHQQKKLRQNSPNALVFGCSV